MSERPRNILYTINNLKTAGMRYVLADLVRGLNRAEFLPTIGVNELTGSPLEEQLKEICRVIPISFRRSKNNFEYFLKVFFRESKRIKDATNLVHSFDYSSEATEGLMAQWAKIPWIMEKTNLSWNEKRWGLRCFCASKIACLSQAQIKLMQKWKQKLVHIPTGVHIARFENAQPLTRAQYSLNDDDIVLLSLAHLIPVKGHRELIRAMLLVSKEYPQLKLVLAGDGEEQYVSELNQQVNELQLKGKVIFERNAQDIPGLLKMCDGKILATRNEGRRESFGAAIVEAMAAGLPVIATKSGGPEEIVVHQKTGWLVEASGHEALAQAMKEFCENETRRKEYGIAGLFRAKELYSKELMIERYETLYREVLNDK